VEHPQSLAVRICLPCLIVSVRFSEEACALFSDSVVGVMKQLQAVPEADKRQHLETCRERSY